MSCCQVNVGNFFHTDFLILLYLRLLGPCLLKSTHRKQLFTVSAYSSLPIPPCTLLPHIHILFRPSLAFSLTLEPLPIFPPLFLLQMLNVLTSLLLHIASHYIFCQYLCQMVPSLPAPAGRVMFHSSGYYTPHMVFHCSIPRYSSPSGGSSNSETCDW